MSYKILEHTADLRMAVRGDSPEHLFSEALAGTMAILKKKLPLEAKARAAKRKIAVESPDLTSLLIDFLNKTLSLSQIHKEIYTKAVFKKFSSEALEAELSGIKVDEFDEDIKAVTYHEAEVKKDKGGFLKTNIVFDI